MVLNITFSQYRNFLKTTTPRRTIMQKKTTDSLKGAIDHFQNGNSGVGGENYWLCQIGTWAAQGHVEAQQCLCKVLMTSHVEELLKTAYLYLTEKVPDLDMETRELLNNFEKNPTNASAIAKAKKEIAEEKLEKKLAQVACVCAFLNSLGRKKTAAPA
jgi:hypothetical protein